MALTRDQLQTRLDAYLAAEVAVLKKQEFTVGDGSTARRLRFADLAEIRAEIDSINRQIQALDAHTAGRRRVMFVR
ncbi:MAG: hypothetical protein RL375_3354 [Pseudomonadota bacterium]|jgi:hypothetical protein